MLQGEVKVPGTMAAPSRGLKIVSSGSVRSEFAKCVPLWCRAAGVYRCEYWDPKTKTWRLSDAQIDQMLRQRSRIEFDPADVPRGLFVSACEAWLKCRRAEADPCAFGHGEVTGM